MNDDGPYQSNDASTLAGELFNGKLTVEEALKRLRTRLLDLSMRNRLLNYRHPKGRSIQFVDEPNLNLLFERLDEGKPVTLAHVSDPPVPLYDNGKKPDVRAYAMDLGIKTSIDFSATITATAYKRLPALQVLQYPGDLEKFARKLATEARTVIEETGTNMLYLMFGFLEYYDSDDSDKAVFAPLISMPVSLTRGMLDQDSRTYRYDLTYSGEDVQENFTLCEKLKQEFRLDLPKLDEEDTPESYFAKIQTAVSKRSRWRVRKRLSLGFLSFGKLAIWADLDPVKATNLLSNDLLRNIFEGGRAAASDAFHAEDYDIDGHPDGELPLIYDADSSQHSAIIDVRQGLSLVINGPPGTGKSQTITNIIASAMADGKKVLFVSEKLAALEVVKQRLEAAGLGDFCLELHSHKTQKKQLLKSIEQRMDTRFKASSGYANRSEALRERRRSLNTYAELLGSKVGNQLDLTVHEVFWAAERRRVELGAITELVADLKYSSAGDWHHDLINKCRMVLSTAANAAIELGFRIQECPWTGYVPDLMVSGDELPVLGAVELAYRHVQVIDDAAQSLVLSTGHSDWSIYELLRSQEAFDALPSPVSDMDTDLLHQMLPRGLASVQIAGVEVARLSAQLKAIRELRTRAHRDLLNIEIDDGARFTKAMAAVRALLAESALHLTPQGLSEFVRQLYSHVEGIETLLRYSVTKYPKRPKELLVFLDDSVVLAEAPSLAEQNADALKAAAQAAIDVCKQVSAGLKQVHDLLRPSGVDFVGSTDELRALIDGRGFPEIIKTNLAADESAFALTELVSTGFGDWTSERFANVGRDLREDLNAASLALDGISALCTRIGIPVDISFAGLQSLETMLSIAVDAPRDLLAHRGTGFEHPEFAETAIRAEEKHDAVIQLAASVNATFYIDTLPDQDDMRASIRVFRRGDSFLNFFKSDWRHAKRMFVGCTKRTKRLSAEFMSENLSLALRWKQSIDEYSNDQQFQTTLGSLFGGLETDYSKLRRLHSWYRKSALALLEGEVTAQLNLTTVLEQHLALLAVQAPRIRGWSKTLQELPSKVATMPGVDPALGQVRRIDELLEPLASYAQQAEISANLLRQVVRPNVTVARAVNLLELESRIAKNTHLFEQLVDAPRIIATVAARIGMPESSLAYQNLPTALKEVEVRTASLFELAIQLVDGVGASLSPSATVVLLRALGDVETFVAPYVPSFFGKGRTEWAGLLGLYRESAGAASELIEFVLPYARADASVWNAGVSLQAALDAQALLSNLETDLAFRGQFGKWIRGIETDEQSIAACMQWASDVRAVARDLPIRVADALLGANIVQVEAGAREALIRASSAHVKYKSAMTELERQGALDWNRWGGGPTPKDALTRLLFAKENRSALVPWSKFLAAKADAVELGLSAIVAKLEDGALAPEKLVLAFEWVLYRSLSKNILSTQRELARFSGPTHEELRSEFSVLDKELIALNGTEYAARIDKAKKLVPGVSAGRAGDLTEMSLLTKETKKQKRHIAIRQLLKRAGHSLQELKPCFMMGPLSVAQYLEQGHLKFDLVVMDEASQLRPEDALGAVARASQLVVVGDPKQLPPTNFFDRLMGGGDDEDEDEAPAVMDGAESILGICEHLYRPVRTLRWHYRSKHESLIAFSNSQFYDGRMVVFPSPYKRNRKLGVNYRYVKDGIYQDRRNAPEARRVVDAVIEHMLTNQEESLGVVTLNQTQRELIEDLFDKKVRNLAGIAEYIAKHEEAGWKFFVKNLENVQGDERDVIFVSTTFGKAPNSSVVRQNFGPINRPDGWRRLNVLFTRARRRLDVFTSMLPTDILADDSVSIGRRAFRDYLEYARSGMLPASRSEISGREPDSDFEIAVANALRMHGYDTEPQVGVAGYFIDIGVRHPERKGEFLAGIECDGATYHSSLSARDRDRIRQEVLESIGWRGRIIRVWSTDWFANPVIQTKRLCNFLQQRREESTAETYTYTEDDLDVFTGDDADIVSNPSNPIEEFSVLVSANSSDSIRTVADTSDVFVEVGDRVTYVVTDVPDEKHTVQIVDSASNPRLGLLNENTPVALALLGLGVGDEAILEVPRQPPHSIRLLKIHREMEEPSDATQGSVTHAAK